MITLMIEVLIVIPPHNMTFCFSYLKHFCFLVLTSWWDTLCCLVKQKLYIDSSVNGYRRKSLISRHHVSCGACLFSNSCPSNTPKVLDKLCSSKRIIIITIIIIMESSFLYGITMEILKTDIQTSIYESVFFFFLLSNPFLLN